MANQALGRMTLTLALLVTGCAGPRTAPPQPTPTLASSVPAPGGIEPTVVPIVIDPESSPEAPAPPRAPVTAVEFLIDVSDSVPKTCRATESTLTTANRFQIPWFLLSLYDRGFARPDVGTVHLSASVFASDYQSLVPPTDASKLSTLAGSWRAQLSGASHVEPPKRPGGSVWSNYAEALRQGAASLGTVAQAERRTLILLTDGVFDWEETLGEAEGALQEVLARDTRLSIFVVLLCPNELDQAQIDLWDQWHGLEQFDVFQPDEAMDGAQAWIREIASRYFPDLDRPGSGGHWVEPINSVESTAQFTVPGYSRLSQVALLPYRAGSFELHEGTSTTPMTSLVPDLANPGRYTTTHIPLGERANGDCSPRSYRVVGDAATVGYFTYVIEKPQLSWEITPKHIAVVNNEPINFAGMVTSSNVDLDRLEGCFVAQTTIGLASAQTFAPNVTEAAPWQWTWFWDPPNFSRPVSTALRIELKSRSDGWVAAEALVPIEVGFEPVLLRDLGPRLSVREPSGQKLYDILEMSVGFRYSQQPYTASDIPEIYAVTQKTEQELLYASEQLPSVDGVGTPSCPNGQLTGAGVLGVQIFPGESVGPEHNTRPFALTISGDSLLANGQRTYLLHTYRYVIADGSCGYNTILIVWPGAVNSWSCDLVLGDPLEVDCQSSAGAMSRSEWSRNP